MHPARWRDEMVTSRDGTRICFRSFGQGPGLVVLPGNNRRAHHYEALGRDLAGGWAVHAIDRRGRGGSGPQGAAYDVEKEVDDALAVMEATGAGSVFGHSFGGLIALHLALRRPLASLIVYEPGVSIDGSFDARWLPELTRLVQAGKHNAAMAMFLKRTRLAPVGDAPMFVFRALAFLLLHGSDGADTRAMMSTTPAEIGEIVRLDSDGSRYARIGSRTLLLGGGKTPRYITDVLPRLARVIPHARYELLPALDHNAPDLNAPSVVADQIRQFTQEGIRAS